MTSDFEALVGNGEILHTRFPQDLLVDRSWTYGPFHALDTAKPFFEFKKNVIGKKCCEVGCGTSNPLGPAAILFLNGASEVVAFDLDSPVDVKKSAEALCELIILCLQQPELFHLSEIERSEFVARARRFDLGRLSSGDLYGGVKGTDVRHYVSSIYGLDPAVFRDVNVTYSRAVLEHVPDVQRASKAIWDIMAFGGYGIHLVDFVDHRAYRYPDSFNYWSFLCEGEDWVKGVLGGDICNRLRPSEFLRIFESTGFSVEELWRTSEDIPDSIYANIKSRFRSFSRQELQVTSTAYYIEKT